VDDEPLALQGMEMALRSGGLNNILSCQDSAAVMPLLGRQQVDAILLDLWMPGISGEALLDQLMHDFPAIPVIIITGVNEVDTAVRCMKNGAFDYLVKPVEKDRLVTVVLRAIKIRELQCENEMLKQRVLSSALEHPEAFEQILTQNDQMLSIFRYVEAISRTTHPVMITGETGVGKELIARAIHALSKLPGPFVSVNSAGLDDTVFADTLFGHKRGAFTSADSAREGMVKQAAGGTLFLDEIGDLSIPSQVKLLRLIQECEYFPLGSDLAKRMDARVIVATNQDLESRQQSGQFRKDLYYRLCTHLIHIPALRDRLDDLALLVDYFLEEAAQEMGKTKPALPAELLPLLGTYAFPGNVRQLRSMICDAMSNHQKGVLSLQSFLAATGQPHRVHSEREASVPPGFEASLSFSERLPNLAEAQRLLVAEAMARAKGNHTVAARMLGITRQALYRRLKGKGTSGR